MNELNFHHFKQQFKIKVIKMPGYPRDLWPYLPNVKKFYKDTIIGKHNHQEYEKFKKSFKHTKIKEFHICDNGNSRTSFILVNKHANFLHCYYDIMVMASSPKLQCGIEHLSSKSLISVLKIAKEFANFVYKKNIIKKYNLGLGEVVCGFNYDPFKGDREGVVSYKRFHFHLNFLDKRMLGQLAGGETNPVGGSVFKQQFVDKDIELTTNLMYDRLIRSNITNDNIKLLPPNLNENLYRNEPVGLKFRLEQGFDYVANLEFEAFLRKLHFEFLNFYNQLYTIFTGKKYEPMVWERPNLVEKEQIYKSIEGLDLSDKSKALLKQFTHKLRTIPPETIEYLKNRPTACANVLFLGGPMYAISIVKEQDNKAILQFNIKCYSCVGGAGFFGLHNNSFVKIKRGVNTLTEHEMEKRRTFQNEFAETLVEKGIVKYK